MRNVAAVLALAFALFVNDGYIDPQARRYPVQAGTAIQDARGAEFVFLSFAIQQPGTRPLVTCRPLRGGAVQQRPLSDFPLYTVRAWPPPAAKAKTS